ncbi:hypothetical protein [Nonomuraea sp. NPDC005650]|uniref:hypothetical protein n=1 Tax=Nonomuraea sp. NPDC005650 TaxID=3157045 RepID=UPI0033BA9F85
MAANGVTVDDLPDGCSIKAAPGHVKVLFAPGAQWLLDRVHYWNHRGRAWGELPALADQLFPAHER